MRALVAIAALVAACGGGKPAPSRAAALPAITAQPHGPGDPIVATVDGRPVYGSCVAAQAAALREDRTHALDDCIGFELLAGAAAARGVAKDAGVIDEYRRALVGRYLDVDFRDRFGAWSDLPADVRDPTFDRLAWHMHRPEYRFAVYVRAELGEKSTPADEAAAHALIDEIYARLKGRADLFPADLFAVADEVAHGRKLDELHTPYGTGLDGPGHKSFTEPLFALPAIGSITPPVRTKWGWDLILWTDTMPALETSADELRAQLFPELRHQWFEHWIDDLARARNDDISVDDALFARVAGS